MSNCPCCSNPLLWDELETALAPTGETMNYCPVCGQSRGIIDFLKYAGAVVRGVIIETVPDENGKPMILDRTPWADPPDKPASTPISYEVNLDKIDISREMELLDKHQKKESDRRVQFLADRIAAYLIKKEQEKEN